jgi:hypothetical protein
MHVGLDHVSLATSYVGLGVSLMRLRTYHDEDER